MIDITQFQFVLIAGASGSGKSELARRLRQDNPTFSTLRMDSVLDALDLAKLSVGDQAYSGHQHSEQVMQTLGPALCRSVLASGEPTIIEGGWVEPSDWELISRSHDAVAALFLGYPTISAAELLKRLSSTEHWLSSGEDRVFVDEQIAHSANLREQVLNLPRAAFVDVSGGHFEDEDVRRSFSTISASLSHVREDLDNPL